MKYLIMQFSSTSCHFISLRSKYSPQTPSVYVLPLMSETKFHTHTEPQAQLLLHITIHGNYHLLYYYGDRTTNVGMGGTCTRWRDAKFLQNYYRKT
jgi:hypothetical protein